MSTIEQAIKEAQDAGWEMHRNDWYWSEMEDAKKIYRSSIFLDPTFWQALARARGWKGSAGSFYGMDMEVWKLHWHRFVDFLAEDKTAEQFFAGVYKT